MKIKSIFGLSFWLLLLALSCKDDDFDFAEAAASLRFSRDTLVLDTVYSKVRSETYLVKVYNDDNRDINIPNIALEGGASSLYKINVDGRSGTAFSNIPLRKKDSLFIFVDIAPEANVSEFLAEDNIVFTLANKVQKVNLRSVVQDAEFFLPNSANANILSDNTVWTSDKAKIISGNLTLAEGKSLTIAEGTKVYFTKNASLKISKNAQLRILGTAGKEVVLRGERNDPRYDTIPLNWNGIQLEEGAVADIRYAKISGGSTALTLNHAQATLKNTVIHTFQDYGILGINAQVVADQLVMNNFGLSAIAATKGGQYDIHRSTLANYRNFANYAEAAVFTATNEGTGSGNQRELAGFNLRLSNSIAYTDRPNALKFAPVSGQNFSYTIANSLVKVGEGSGYSWENNASIVNSIKNEDPLFINYFIRKMNLRLKDNSPVKSRAMGAY